MRQSSELEPLSEAQTEAALHRSRDFLRQRLVPDVERAEVRIRSLEDDKGRYEQLIGELDGHSYDRARLAPLGMGIHVPVTVEPKELIIVSMGLSTVSETAWSRSQSDEQQPAEQQPLQKPDSSTADAGLYAELTIDQARTFSQRKVAILQKWVSYCLHKWRSSPPGSTLLTRCLCKSHQKDQPCT